MSLRKVAIEKHKNGGEQDYLYIEQQYNGKGLSCKFDAANDDKYDVPVIGVTTAVPISFQKNGEESKRKNQFFNKLNSPAFSPVMAGEHKFSCKYEDSKWTITKEAKNKKYPNLLVHRTPLPWDVHIFVSANGLDKKSHSQLLTGSVFVCRTNNNGTENGGPKTEHYLMRFTSGDGKSFLQEVYCVGFAKGSPDVPCGSFTNSNDTIPNLTLELKENFSGPIDSEALKIQDDGNNNFCSASTHASRLAVLTVQWLTRQDLGSTGENSNNKKEWSYEHGNPYKSINLYGNCSFTKGNKLFRNNIKNHPESVSVIGPKTKNGKDESRTPNENCSLGLLIAQHYRNLPSDSRVGIVAEEKLKSCEPSGWTWEFCGNRHSENPSEPEYDFEAKKNDTQKIYFEVKAVQTGTKSVSLTRRELNTFAENSKAAYLVRMEYGAGMIPRSQDGNLGIDFDSTKWTFGATFWKLKECKTKEVKCLLGKTGNNDAGISVDRFTVVLNGSGNNAFEKVEPNGSDVCQLLKCIEKRAKENNGH